MSTLRTDTLQTTDSSFTIPISALAAAIQTVNGLSDTSPPDVGAALIGYLGRNLQTKLAADLPTVKDFGAVGNGIADDTAAIQAAVNAGDVGFGPGNYLIKAPIYVPSNRKISGVGFNSKVTIAVDAVGVPTVWAGTLWAAFWNSNIVSSGANSHIEITNLYIDGNNHPQNPFLTHFRNCQYVTVDRCILKGGGDGTAFTMSQNWKCSNNFAFGQMNCCYDSWENSSEGLYENNIGYVTLGYGMLCTGDTSLNTVGTSANVSFIGNTIIGPSNANGSVGIWLQSGSNLTSNCYTCRVIGNYVRGFQAGIRATGGGNHSISGNTVLNCPSGGIVLGAEVVGNGSSFNSVSTNVLSNCGDAASFPIALQTGANNNVLTGNITGTTTSPYALSIDASSSGNTVANNGLTAGTSGFVNNIGGDTNFANNTRTGNYTQGSFVPTLTSSGGGTPTYSAQYGDYQFNGNRVFGTIRVALSTLGSLAAGNIVLTGLPQISNSGSVNNQPACAISATNMQAAITACPTARVVSGTSTIALYKWASGSATPLVVSDLTGTSEVSLSFSYRV